MAGGTQAGRQVPGRGFTLAAGLAAPVAEPDDARQEGAGAQHNGFRGQLPAIRQCQARHPPGLVEDLDDLASDNVDPRIAAQQVLGGPGVGIAVVLHPQRTDSGSTAGVQDPGVDRRGIGQAWHDAAQSLEFENHL